MCYLHMHFLHMYTSMYKFLLLTDNVVYLMWVYEPCVITLVL
jgi:hypothetical protein